MANDTFKGPLFDDANVGKDIERAFLRRMYAAVDGPIRERLKAHVPRRTGRLRRSFVASRGKGQVALGFRGAPYYRYQRRALATLRRLWQGEMRRNAPAAYAEAVQEVIPND